MRLRKVCTQNIESAEHPAATRLFLVRNVLLRSLYAEVFVEGELRLAASRKVVDVVIGNGIGNSFLGSSGRLSLHNFLKHLLGNASLVLLGSSIAGHH